MTENHNPRRQVKKRLSEKIKSLPKTPPQDLQLASFPEMNPNPVMEVDEKGFVNYVNPAAKKLFPDIEAKGSKHPWLEGLDSTLTLSSTTEKTSYSREVKVDNSWYQQTIRYIPTNRHIQIFGFNISKHKHIEELYKALSNINIVIHSTLEFDSIMRKVVVLAAKAIGCDTAAISLRKGDRWVVTYVYGFPKELIGSVMQDAEEKHAILVIETKKSVAINDAWSDDRVNREHMKKYGIRSVLVIPLLSKDKPIGVLLLNFHSIHVAFTESQLDFADNLAASISFALENSRLFQEQKQGKETLEKAVDDLARSNAELEQFAYAASHDLQEPLRGIAGFAGLLERRYKGKLDGKADEFIDYIIDDTKRMQMLIKGLLEYSRISAKGIVFRPVNCSVALEQAIYSLRASIAESGAEVTYDPLPMVMGDESQLSRVFQNLIGNAIKFHSKDPLKIHITAERKENEWIFSVRDNGIGIESQYKKRIFVIFQRLHAKGQYPGTGLGLTVCKNILERHGGRIWVESEIGKGSIFYFTIPYKEIAI